MTTDLAYPIGKFQPPAEYSPDTRAAAIRRIAEAPAMLRLAVAGLTDEQLDTPYREGGWTVRQVVHHVADSHVNMMIRLKLALTEEQPPLKAYDEQRWALLPDAKLPVEPSLAILDGVHARILRILRSLDAAQFDRIGMHTENGPTSVDRMLALYAWHGAHHAAHVTGLRSRRGW
jgi:uncharacterized damage-inducible protein DinB